MPRVVRPKLIERGMSRFLRQPPSVMTAAGVNVTATAVVVVVGEVLMRVLDHTEYSNVWVGIANALQASLPLRCPRVPPKSISNSATAARLGRPSTVISRSS